MEMAHRVEGWVCISRYWNNSVSSTKLVSFAKTYVEVDHIVWQIDTDIASDENFSRVELARLGHCVRLPE